MRMESLVVATLSLAWLLAMQGCSSQESAAPSNSNQTTGVENPETPTEHEHGDPMNEDVQANLAKLSESDRAAVEKQHHCPVSGKQLGSMDAPIVVDVEGQQVWLCCESCKDSLMAEPDKYLSKLP